MGDKPLGRKAYGSIGHLPGSLKPPTDRAVHEGQARICTEKPRDKHDRIIVTEKLDGTNVAVVKTGSDCWSPESVRHPGPVVALNRRGWPCISARREMHRLFAQWVAGHVAVFEAMLKKGEALHGEWLAQAHGTLYDLDGPNMIGRPPFVAFDLTETGSDGARMRLPHDALKARCREWGISTARVLSDGPPLTVADARAILESGRRFHGTRDGEIMEGAVWRVERRGAFDFLAKWVNPEKGTPGKYLPEQSGKPEVWLWRPERPMRGKR